MSTINDLETKRSELNNAVDGYKQDQSPAVLETAKTRGYEYAKLAGAVRKANPAMAEDDLFSGPVKLTANRRLDVRTILTNGRLATDPYLYDDFTDASLNVDVWDVFGPNQDVVTINNGELILDLPNGGDRSGIVSKESFPVGAVYRARVKNDQGRHAILAGVCNDPSRINVSENPPAFISWYSRGTYSKTTVGSYLDENGERYLGDSYTDINHIVYHIVEIRRISATKVEFYVDDVLKHTMTTAVFSEDYKVFFAVDGYDQPNTMTIDWVEVSVP